ncbi:MAG: hypothetical protein ACOX3W_03860 [Christensenellaceae bacterium]|jgi:hypothetical protein
MIVLSDGFPNRPEGGDPAQDAIDAARAAESEDGVTVFSIAAFLSENIELDDYIDEDDNGYATALDALVQPEIARVEAAYDNGNGTMEKEEYDDRMDALEYMRGLYSGTEAQALANLAAADTLLKDVYDSGHPHAPDFQEMLATVIGPYAEQEEGSSPAAYPYVDGIYYVYRAYLAYKIDKDAQDISLDLMDDLATSGTSYRADDASELLGAFEEILEEAEAPVQVRNSIYDWLIYPTSIDDVSVFMGAPDNEAELTGDAKGTLSLIEGGSGFIWRSNGGIEVPTGETVNVILSYSVSLADMDDWAPEEAENDDGVFNGMPFIQLGGSNSKRSTLYYTKGDTNNSAEFPKPTFRFETGTLTVSETFGNDEEELFASDIMITDWRVDGEEDDLVLEIPRTASIPSVLTIPSIPGATTTLDIDITDAANINIEYSGAPVTEEDLKLGGDGITLDVVLASGINKIFYNFGLDYDGPYGDLTIYKEVTGWPAGVDELTFDFEVTSILLEAPIPAQITITAPATTGSITLEDAIPLAADDLLVTEKDPSALVNYTLTTYAGLGTSVAASPATEGNDCAFAYLESATTADVAFLNAYAFDGEVEYTIISSADTGGSITPLGNTDVAAGGSQSYVISANTGYQIKDILVDNQTQGALANYTFSNVQADHTIHATFEPIPPGVDYVILSSADTGGSINPLGNTGVAAGGNQSYAITAAANYKIKDVLVDGRSIGALASYTFSNVQANHTIHATFEPINDGGVTYLIVSSAGAGGSINPLGNTTVPAGGFQAYSMQAAEGYKVKDVLVDGVSIGTATSYNFTNVQANHTIHVTFETTGGDKDTPPGTNDGSHMGMYLLLMAAASVLLLVLLPKKKQYDNR